MTLPSLVDAPMNSVHDAAQTALEAVHVLQYPSDEGVLLVAVVAFVVSAAGGFIGGAVVPYLQARRSKMPGDRNPEHRPSRPGLADHSC